jgi:hypothetical protein
MKNKLLIGIVTVLVGITFCVVVMNFTDSKDIKDYYFKRKFSYNEVLQFEKKYDKMAKDDYLRYTFSDNFIVENDKKSINKNSDSYEFKYTNLDFSSKKIKKIILPKNVNVILFDSTKLFYTYKFELYEYNCSGKISRKIKLNNFKAFYLTRIPAENDKYLCFGESFENNKFIMGFHIIDTRKESLLTTKVIEISNSTKMPKNELIYSGKFLTLGHNKMISYCCDKYSSIYFFNNNGIFLKELKTKDNTPLPKIFKNEQGDSFYSRGGTWSTNYGLFMKDNKVYVFSARSNEKLKIVIDQYFFSNLEYEQSFKLNYNNLDTRSINTVFEAKNKIIIGFEFNYASFTFSRYI